MSLSFLPDDIKNALEHLNANYLSEIRLRKGQPVIVEYRGEYGFLGVFGLTQTPENALIAGDIDLILNSATGGCVFGYIEQMKNGFITVEHGVRIGIAGEYVTEGGRVNTIKNLTSLNIRVPHNVYGCADYVCKKIFKDGLHSTLIFSKPGLGKTTMLRDIARTLSTQKLLNVLILDERNEISAMDAFGEGFDVGRADVVRCFNKLGAISSAIRAMKPTVLITDELYGEDDLKAVKYAADCGITVIASSHVTDRTILKTMPFEYFAELTSVGGKPCIYDKNFNSYCNSRADNFLGSDAVGE